MRATAKTKRARIITIMLNPFSWSLDSWFVVLQASSAAILGLTVAVGYFVNKRQSAKILTLERSNIELQRTLEAERSTRIEMEESLAPRMLISNSEVIRRLQHFAGTPYVLEFVPDAETEHLAGLVAWVLNLSDWKQLRAVRHFDTPIRDGIAVEAKPANGETPPAARDFAEYLEANGLRVFTASLKGNFRLEEIPDGAVRIRVGFRPNPYFENRFADETVRTKQLLDALATPGLERRQLSKEEIDRLRKEWYLPSKS